MLSLKNNPKLISIKETWKYIKSQKTFQGLFQTIPFGFFSSSAVILLCVVIFSLLVRRVFSWSYAFTSVGLICAFLEIFYIAWFFVNGNRIKKTDIKENILPICFILLLVWALASALINGRITGMTFHREGFFTYLAYAGVFCMTGLIRSEKSARGVLSFLTIFGGLMSLWYLFQNNIDRSVAFFSNQNHYGYFLCMTIPLALGLFISSDNKYRFVYLIEAMLLTTGLIFCNSTGPLLAVVISVVCFIVFTAILHKKKIFELLLGVLLCVVSGAVSAFFGWDLGADLQKMFSDASVLTSKVIGGGADITEEEFNHIGSSRGVLWKQCLGFIKERPIFGFGPDGLYDQYYFLNGNVNLPHNEFLQIAGTLGLPALGFYLAGLISLFIRFIKRFKALSPLQLTLFVCVLSYLISSFFGCTMDYTYPFFMMLLGFCFNLSKNENDKIIKN